MPSTVSATITMVANTGWLMATRVIHMASARGSWVALLYRARAAFALEARGLTMLQIVEFGRDHVLQRLQAGEDLDQVSAVVARAGRDRAALEAAGHDHPDVGLGSVAAHGGYRQRRGLALGRHREAHAREHARLEE